MPFVYALFGAFIRHGELMTRRDIVVIGASAGGVEALKALIAELPATLPENDS